MEMKDLKIACIGAGCSGTGHLIALENLFPGVSWHFATLTDHCSIILSVPTLAEAVQKKPEILKRIQPDYVPTSKIFLIMPILMRCLPRKISTPWLSQPIAVPTMKWLKSV